MKIDYWAYMAAEFCSRLLRATSAGCVLLRYRQFCREQPAGTAPPVSTDSYQTTLYEPIHDNPKLGNTHYTQLTKENMHLGTFGTWGRTTS